MNNNQWLSIRASAGSGKTFALTSRYIYLLFCGARASEILCITFTNKARQEMLERITQTLASLAQKSQDLNTTTNPYAQDLISKGIAAEIIYTQSKVIYTHFITSNNHIMTFDAFFNMIVKKFSFYAGILSDYEVSANFDASSEAFCHTLDSLNKRDFEQLVRFCVTNDLRTNNLRSMIQKIDNVQISHIAPNPNFKQEVIAEFNALRNFILEITDGKKGVSRLRNRFLKTMDLTDIDAIVDSLNLTQPMKDALESLNYNKEFYETKLQNIKALLKNHFDFIENDILVQISSIYDIYKECKNEILKSTNKLNFDDISNVCYDLLNNNIYGNFFYFRLDSKINHILIDEFQDTNLRQYEILKPLIDEIKSGEGRIGNRSLFFVGDEKQAIYGFRGCDSRIFRAISDELHLQRESLPKNFRSAKNIVEFVNTLFKRHFKDYIAQEANSNKNGFVAVVTKTKDEIFPTLKARIQTLLNNNKHSIAVLTRKTSSAKEIYEFLRIEFPQIKISVESESNTNKEYLIILNALKFAQTGNLFYLKNCEKLNGELFEISESHINQNDFNESKSNSSDLHKTDLQLNIKNLTLNTMEVNQIVYYFIKHFALYGSVALQILEASADFDEIDLFVDFLQNTEIKSSSDSKSTIQIMTIHKSKGLEFGDVIICEYSGGARNLDIFYTENFRSNKIYYLGNASFRTQRAFADAHFAQVWETKQTQDKIDALNLLYVAFTRAKESLFIIKPNNIRGGDALKLGLLDLEDIEIGEDIVGESAKSIEIDNANIPKQTDFGRQNELIDEDLNDYTTKSQLKGLAMHKAMELYLAYGTKKSDILTILRNRFGLILNEQDLNKALKNMENILQNTVFCEILKNADNVRCEVAYWADKLKRIDCLVEQGEKAIILDYKSSDLDLEAKKAQIAEYICYARQHYKSVEGYLCFANGEILRV